VTRTVDELLDWARGTLESADFAPPRREAALLLGRVLDWPEARVLSRGEAVVPSDEAVRFERLVIRRLEGEPVAYLIGEREFFGRSFNVDSRVLIPRPETEHLVETVLSLDLPGSPRILDLGTGSGCIAVTLACEISGAHIVALDASLQALAVARTNVRRHDVIRRVLLLCSDLATASHLDTFDIIVSNPPYIDPQDESTLSGEITAFEPHKALFAPARGISIITRLTEELSGLRSGRYVIFEIGADQADQVSTLLSRSDLELVEIRPDLARRPRVAVARRR
jgi:release factor glutamine methyltransferase